MSIDLQSIVAIALEAGEMAKRRRAELSAGDVLCKGNETDIVTVADKENEQFIQRSLHNLYPDIAFYGEEGVHGDINSYDRVFVVDPIDGTTNYVHGYPFYAVSIGLREQGQTTAGVVYVPVMQDIYAAQKDQGATKNGRPIHVSSVSSLIEAVAATGFGCVRAKCHPDNVDLMASMVRRLQGIRRSGSAALDLCHLAEGCVDLFWEIKLSPWDYEAGKILVAEAGGKVTSLDGSPMDDSTGRILASNGILHDQMVQIATEYLSR